MGLFNNLKNEGLEETQDRLGGFAPVETDAYLATIKAAYAGKSDGGAQSLTVIATLPGGREYTETLWVTNKKGENWFLNPQDKTKKVGLPGFTIANELCLLTCEKELSEMDDEEKVVNIYNFDQKKQVPTKVQMLTEMIGKTVYLGIVKQLENKSAKDGAGVYQPTAETREINVIEKVFHDPSKLTLTEAKNEKPAEFFDSWVERNKGNTRDRRKIKDGAAGNAGRPNSGPPQAGAGSTPARTSLFGGKKD